MLSKFSLARRERTTRRPSMVRTRSSVQGDEERTPAAPGQAVQEVEP